MAKVRPSALLLIFAALGRFSQPDIWSKNINKSIRRTIKAEIVTLSSLIRNCAIDRRPTYLTHIQTN